MKNYIDFVNDNSGSMSVLAAAACRDYNDNIAAGKVAAPVKPAVVQLPAVPVSNAPTKSPIPVTPRVQTVFFMTREEARQEAQAQGKSPIDLGKTAPKGKRWTIG